MALKQRFNTISHMVGGGLALVSVPFLVVRAHGAVATAAASVYGASLVVMYTLSVLFHAIPHKRAEPWLLRLDQVGIYLLIAGTYTPVALVLFGGAPGFILFLVEWTDAAIGTYLLLAKPATPDWVHQAAYIILGWAAVLWFSNLQKLPTDGLVLLIVGGVLYSVGAFLSARNRPRLIGRLGDHEMWHLMVLAASALHTWFILAYVL